MEGYSTSRVVVDGSTHYIAIRLPSGEDEAVQPLRTILKSEGFLLEPSNRKWWLRDRHKTLNFLAGYWKALKDEWQANSQTTLKLDSKVEISALQIEAKEEAGKFALAISLSEQTDETELRRALASSKNYVETNEVRITLLDRNSIEQLHEIERAVGGQADCPFTPLLQSASTRLSSLMSKTYSTNSAKVGKLLKLGSPQSSTQRGRRP